MSRNLLMGLLLAGTALTSGAARAAEPSLHQIYQAAEAGRLDQAQSMMREVLQAHPDSGKAHYVEAELLARQGQNSKAQVELATAERLAPGLPFAKPQAVQELRGQLGGGNARSAPTASQFLQAAPAASSSSVPWGLLLGGVGLIAFIAFVSRAMRPRGAQPALAGASAGGFGSGSPTPYAGGPLPGYGGGAPAGSAEPGLGSRVIGGLATGAAMGAGMVAAEALAHRFLDKREEPTTHKLANDPGPLDLGTPVIGNDPFDMGGNDFGINDTASWDDGGNSSSNDWN